MIHVLVADDSPTARTQLVRLLRTDPEIVVVGEAQDGIEAVAAAKRLHPHLILMDALMPRLNGIEATKRIMFDTPTPIIVVSSALTTGGVAVSLEALRAGAVHALPKPTGVGLPEFEEESRRFLRTIKTMANVKVVRRRSLVGSVLRHDLGDPANLPRPRMHPRVVAMAASTGGPAAIYRILSSLPDGFSVPILLVQHISSGFIDDFAHWLDGASPLRVKVAEDGESLLPATVYVAPADKHLGVHRGAVALSIAPPVDGFRPSASYLFESVARAFGATSLAVLLTGMGRDGVAGLRAIDAVHGAIITQDESTCVVYGMPGVATEAGLSGTILPLDSIAPYITTVIEAKT